MSANPIRENIIFCKICTKGNPDKIILAKMQYSVIKVVSITFSLVMGVEVIVGQGDH